MPPVLIAHQLYKTPSLSRALIKCLQYTIDERPFSPMGYLSLSDSSGDSPPLLCARDSTNHLHVFHVKILYYHCDSISYIIPLSFLYCVTMITMLWHCDSTVFEDHLHIFHNVYLMYIAVIPIGCFSM